jgi:hypothetical protein
MKVETPGPTSEQWAYCPTCDLAFRIAITIPCPLDLYLAALRTARCPDCNGRHTLIVYQPGDRPSGPRPRAPRRKARR